MMYYLQRNGANMVIVSTVRPYLLLCRGRVVGRSVPPMPTSMLHMIAYDRVPASRSSTGLGSMTASHEY